MAGRLYDSAMNPLLRDSWNVEYHSPSNEHNSSNKGKVHSSYNHSSTHSDEAEDYENDNDDASDKSDDIVMINEQSSQDRHSNYIAGQTPGTNVQQFSPIPSIDQKVSQESRASDFYSHKTISDDHSGDSGHNRQLLNVLQPQHSASLRRDTGSNGGALADYQMQLMLLEQQKKKGLMVARQENMQRQNEVSPLPMEMERQGNMPTEFKLSVKQDGAYDASKDKSPERHATASNSSARADYDMQLLLLEQENKRRLMTARQKNMQSENEVSPVLMEMERQDNVSSANPTSLPAPMGSIKTTSSSADRLPSKSMATHDLDERIGKSDTTFSISDEARSPMNNLQSLQQYISQLQAKAESLEQLERQLEPSKYQILYRIINPKQTSVYFDRPAWVSGERGERFLQSNLPLSNFSLFLEKHRDVAFVIYKDYDMHNIPQTSSNGGKRGEDDSDVVPHVASTSESIAPVTSQLASALKKVLESKSSFENLRNSLHVRNELPSPYLFIYHSRDALDELTETMTGPEKRQFNVFREYVEKEYGSEYRTADQKLAENCTSIQLMKYLFKPNDILVHGKGDQIRAYVSKSWPTHPTLEEVRIDPRTGSKTVCAVSESTPTKNSEVKRIKAWDIDVWSWNFDGKFRRSESVIRLEVDADGEEEKSIQDLEIRPLSHTDQTTIDKLRQRGDMFWRCRFRRLVSYVEKTDNAEVNPHLGERYMIDMETYKKLHSSFEMRMSSYGDELQPEAMNQDFPPDKEFNLLLPLKIKGFSLDRKKWVDLHADRIRKVEWNKEAFKTLVLHNKTKSLIQALISSHISPEKSTDLISGKGNGLVLLLHGGPGTGKTLTAESVAEIAEKPLYRVTCGDIGTDPQEVEKYLESVLNLGKIWGCVVLLDEADVFLEQRSLEDLRRNALVSVFLRQLEYYDGILILTSNRVGTFDEAFKSRIQLALHYANLDIFQRRKIWEMFFRRLELLEDGDIDLGDLKDHLERLAENKMNGRQIRNAITTARQYAQWKKSTLNYEQLQDVIDIAGGFDRYLDKLHGGYTQDQLAEEEGIRLSGHS